MHGSCYSRIPLVQSCSLQVLWKMGCVSVSGQRRTNGQEDCVRHRPDRPLRQWCTICPRQRKVRLCPHSAQVEASSSQHLRPLGNLVWLRGKHGHHQLLDCVRCPDLQLFAVIGGKYRVRAFGIGPSWMAVDLCEFKDVPLGRLCTDRQPTRITPTTGEATFGKRPCTGCTSS